jgi:hypothetical protein
MGRGGRRVIGTKEVTAQGLFNMRNIDNKRKRRLRNQQGILRPVGPTDGDAIIDWRFIEKSFMSPHATPKQWDASSVVRSIRVQRWLSRQGALKRRDQQQQRQK